MRNSLLVLFIAIATSAFAHGGMTWIYKHGDHTHMRSVNDTERDPKAIARQYGDEFIWLARGGQTHVIVDRSVIASVDEVFAERHEHGSRLEAVNERLEERVEELEEITDQIEDDVEDARESLEERMHAAEERMREVEREMRAIESDLRAAESESNHRLMEIVERAIADGKARRVD